MLESLPTLATRSLTSWAICVPPLSYQRLICAFSWSSVIAPDRYLIRASGMIVSSVWPLATAVGAITLRAGLKTAVFRSSFISTSNFSRIARLAASFGRSA